MSSPGSGCSPVEEFEADRVSAPSSEMGDGPTRKTRAISTGDERPNRTAEKTISCISCRGRKLKCDRVKPKCGTCARLRLNCSYPERRRNVGLRRRNMKDLEARLAQVETKLVSGPAKSKDLDIPWTQGGQADWDNISGEMNFDFANEPPIDQPFDVSDIFRPSSMPSTDLWAQEVSNMGLHDTLPPDDMIAELHQLYFDKMHYTAPMIHKRRYLASTDLPAHMQPPLCLRYAIWATGASISEKYAQYEDILYERARQYLDAGEMKNHGEGFATLQHAQTCGLIATYEARKTYFTRAWMTIGRMIRLVQMLSLHRLDSGADPSTQMLPPARDFIELEERRRTFWVAFHGDRWASSGTGWSMMIQEKEIATNFPSSEEAFEGGLLEDGISLQEALTPSGVSKMSIFGGFLLSACLFGHNFAHLRQDGPDQHPEDLANGEFWRRHRTMDNTLSNTFLFLPDHLRLPGGLRDMSTVFLHMNLHTAAICLHQTAIVTAERNNLDPNFIKHVRGRSFMSAEEIVNIMKLVSHIHVSNMNSWTGFCLYAAASVFVQNQEDGDRSAANRSNLEFLLGALKAIGNRHSISWHFITQLELDIANSGMLGPHRSKVPNIPNNAYISEQSSATKAIYDLSGYVRTARIPNSRLLPGILSRADRPPSPAAGAVFNVTSSPSPNNIEAPIDEPPNSGRLHPINSRVDRAPSPPGPVFNVTSHPTPANIEPMDDPSYFLHLDPNTFGRYLSSNNLSDDATIRPV